VLNYTWITTQLALYNFMGIRNEFTCYTKEASVFPQLAMASLCLYAKHQHKCALVTTRLYLGVQLWNRSRLHLVVLTLELMNWTSKRLCLHQDRQIEDVITQELMMAGDLILVQRLITCHVTCITRKGSKDGNYNVCRLVMNLTIMVFW